MTHAKIPADGRERLALDMQARYYAGSSIRNLRDHYGYSYGTVHSLLLSVGTTLRGRGGVKGAKHKRKQS
ncbi:helix-turn-helix domain-containing protein [Streptomyces griseofuscus]|uniref:Transcriptional regulator n=1 Tax=Streptomyces griseofuscus TaxID=146922 RepID=A0A7H1Q3H4_9ACTN|nr:helix-turn-helix domain-containing protein [Streptomyces griseofuscus]QNT94854.1 transcriptional regulator [Streptomyces griseofuscus]